VTYTPATLIKAAIAVTLAITGAASAAAGGPDVSVLDLGQWLTVIGTGLVAGGAVFHNPAKQSVNDKAITSVQDVVTKNR